MNYSIDSVPQWANGQIYNDEMVFTVENYGHIKMMFLLFSVTPSVNSSYSSPTSPNLFQNVQLESNGVPIARMTTTSCLARIDNNQLNYDKIISATTLVPPFNSVQTVSLPLYFWCFDGQELDTSKYTNLQVRVRTKASFSAMGFNNGLSGLSAKLRTVYCQENHSAELQLSKAYNVYSPFEYSLATGTTKHNLSVSVPFNIRAIFMMIRYTGRLKGNINGVVLKKPNGKTYTYNDNTDYFLNSVRGDVDGNTFSIIIDNTEIFNGTKAPLSMEVTYDTLTANATLYVSYEYNSEIIENKGPYGTHLLETQTNFF